MKLKYLWIALIVLIAATNTYANEWDIFQPTSRPDITILTRASNNTKGAYILYAITESKESGIISIIKFFAKTESAAICQKYLREWGKEMHALVNNEKMVLVEHSCDNANNFTYTPQLADDLAYLQRVILDGKEIQFGNVKFDMTGSKKLISEQEILLLRRINNLQ